FWGIVLSLLRSLWQTLSGESMTGPEHQATSVPDDSRSSFAGASSQSTRESDPIADEGEEDTEPFAIEPDPAAGEDTVVQGLGVSHLDSTHEQHGELGGIPDVQGAGEAAPADDA